MEVVTHFIQWLLSNSIFQTLSWGTKCLQFDSGARKTLPMLLQTTSLSMVIRSYEEECINTGRTCISSSTLRRIAAMFPVKRMRRIVGLDSFQAEGLDAIAYLKYLVGDHLPEKKQVYEERLVTAKQFLKIELPLLLNSNSSQCAEHCRQFALSDPTQPDLCTICDHDHGCCRSCEHFLQLFEEITCDINLLGEANY